MTSRSVYQFLLRLHPKCFRKQFEAQMLWIFDESLQSDGAVLLLFDACVSLIRQWVLRSAYWRGGAQSDTLEALHWRSEMLYRRANWANGLWLVAYAVVVWICPVSWSMKLNLFTVFNGFTLAYRGHQAKKAGGYVRRRRQELSWFQNLMVNYKASSKSIQDASDEQSRKRRDEFSMLQEPAQTYRFRKEARRDYMRSWTRGHLLGILCLPFVLVLFANYLRHLFGRPPLTIDRSGMIQYLVGVFVLSFVWLFLKRLNQKAADTIQQEIDAEDAVLSLKGEG